MFTAIRRWFEKRSTTRTSVPVRASASRPSLEALEDRVVPTAITYHGGPLLQHVEVQGLYVGSDFNTSASLQQQVSRTEGFLNSLVHSSYMDLLTNAGYGVGRGSFTPGRIDGRTLNKNVFLTDSQIQGIVQQDVTRGLATPDANRLYVVYVEPGVSIATSFGNSITAFQAYHSSFSGNDGHGHRLNIAYAVIPSHTGRNAHDSRVNTFDSMTESASHEIAEAATDPIPGRGWIDNQSGNEIGDFTHTIVRLNGFVVQELAAKNGRNLIPAGATAIPGIPANQSVAAPARSSVALAPFFARTHTATPSNATTPAPALFASAAKPVASATQSLDALFALGL